MCDAGRDGAKTPTNLNEEKRQREQILALNQVLAQQVMEKSRSSRGGNKQLYRRIVASLNRLILYRPDPSKFRMFLFN